MEALALRASRLGVSPGRCACALKASLRRLCALANQRTISQEQLELFWSFAEHIGTARVVGVDKAFIEAVDRKVDAMDRLRFVELALAHTERGDVDFSVRGTRDEVLDRYLRRAAALDWLVDCAAYTAARISDDVVDRIDALSRRVQAMRADLRRRALRDPSLVDQWLSVSASARRAFLPPLFDSADLRCSA